MPKPKRKAECECKKCGYRWVPRLKNPRECPDCKSRRWQEEPEHEKE